MVQQDRCLLVGKWFDKCDGEPTLYIKESDGKILIVVLYIDHLIFISSDDFFIVDFKEVMKSEFEMIDLGLLRDFLGMEVKQIENGIFISQGIVSKLSMVVVVIKGECWIY